MTEEGKTARRVVRMAMAALCMQGLLAKHGKDAVETGLAAHAVRCADALLQELENPPAKATTSAKKVKLTRDGEVKK